MMRDEATLREPCGLSPRFVLRDRRRYLPLRSGAPHRRGAMIAAPPFGTLKSDYTAYGAAAELFNCREKECLLAGPAGTGKSRAALEKLYAAAVKYPGMRGLIIRKTRASLSEAALQTWEEHVLPENSPLRNGVTRGARRSYVLRNGSEINMGGFEISSSQDT